MGKTKIDWGFDNLHTMNAIHGCSNLCPYCYARRMAYRLRGRCGYPQENPFKPTFTPGQLKKLDRKKPTRFFISSMGDMFDPQVKQEWRWRIYSSMAIHGQHEYFILTKRPDMIKGPDYEAINKLNDKGIKVWLGVSISRNGAFWKAEKLSRESWPKIPLFISFEPLLERLYPRCIENEARKFQYFIIGGKSGPKPFYPKKEWIQNIQIQAEELKIPVYLKNNLEAKK